MSVNIDEIKAAYPNPSTDHETDNPDCYSVGGAILLHAGYDADWACDPPFPDNGELADVLRDLNPGLSESMAFRFAKDLIRKNDLGHFDDAWSIAALALRHTSPTGSAA